MLELLYLYSVEPAVDRLDPMTKQILALGSRAENRVHTQIPGTSLTTLEKINRTAGFLHRQNVTVPALLTEKYPLPLAKSTYRSQIAASISHSGLVIVAQCRTQTGKFNLKRDWAWPEKRSSPDWKKLMWRIASARKRVAAAALLFSNRSVTAFG